MLNLSKHEYLMSLAKPLEMKWFHAKFKENHYYKDSYIALTISNKVDFFHIKIMRKWFHYFGNYNISILCSSINILDEVETVNESAKTNTGFFNFEKRKFHKKLKDSISRLRIEHENYLASVGGFESYRNQIEKLIAELIFEEKLTVTDCVCPAIGLETDEKGVHPVFGIAVGGDRIGGLIMIDPFEGQLEVGAYLGFGDYGIYDSFEFDVTDSIANVDFSWGQN